MRFEGDPESRVTEGKERTLSKREGDLSMPQRLSLKKTKQFTIRR